MVFNHCKNMGKTYRDGENGSNFVHLITVSSASNIGKTSATWKLDVECLEKDFSDLLHPLWTATHDNKLIKSRVN